MREILCLEYRTRKNIAKVEQDGTPEKHIATYHDIYSPSWDTCAHLRPRRLGRYIIASSIQHWGIYVETEEDVESRQGLCVELGRSSGGGIIVLHRTRQKREETEPQTGIKYEKTGKFISWDNDSIVQCGGSLTVVETSRISTCVTDCC